MSKLKKNIAASLLVLLAGLSHPFIVAGQDVHPIVDVNENCLMGGVAGGKWLEADALAPMLKGGERYRLYTLTRAMGETTGAKPSSAGEPCNGTNEIAFSSKPEGGIAVGGSWNALPRVPRSLSTNDPAYRQAVAAVLRRHGFNRPEINITQVLRVDLDGDGIEEALVSASHLAEGISVKGGPMAVHGKPGDYSFVVLRKIVRGKVQDILLAEHFYPRKIEYPETPMQYEVAAVLDLNGDGKMEVIVRGAYYEGSGSSVFRLVGNKAVEAFGCGCGA
jgi:hypothetical protein